MRSPLARREQERFSGWIAGLGTASGHRLVVGHWPTSPFGMVTDVMVEDPGGHRTLYAPTPQLAAFLGAAYRFDDVQVVPCSARRSGPDWMVQAGPLQLSFTIGRRTSWAGCCGRSPPRWPEPPGGWACWTSPPAGCYPGSARAAGPATAAASGTVPRISIASSRRRRHPRWPRPGHAPGRPPTGWLRLRLGAEPTLPGPSHHHDRGCPSSEWRRRCLSLPSLVGRRVVAEAH
jgi:hypothetical protein